MGIDAHARYAGEMMLSARNSNGDVLAMNVDKDDGPFCCPACRDEVILKKGEKKSPHFAHRPETVCEYSHSGESEEHRRAKVAIYQSLLTTPGVTKLQLERFLGEVRPDVSFEFNGHYVAIEVQVSTLSTENIARRTVAYAQKNIAVLWTPPWNKEMIFQRYAPKSWERYLHTLYFGKIYYWDHDIKLQPVTFGPYMLGPSRFAPEKRSERFVTTSWLAPVSIIDLTSVWRREWNTFPKAKLWIQPWQGEIGANK
ncbi:hypothetical protein KDA_30170 [Dictyobacter alpinus]|uniref:Competence protein CoiA n=1 Tax=Dictyobacter alpinus TaxID=2014873 RepID=A0A402B7Z1_9CHLR|nr:competence protein CoiA family protein [Dictyobacter alpinus]GCE27533.1 hypothetical protein KDA_30170 [Dictyobacter alpinus]